HRSRRSCPAGADAWPAQVSPPCPHLRGQEGAVQTDHDPERLLALHQIVRRVVAEGQPERFQADLLAEAVALLEGTGGAIYRGDASRSALVSLRRLSSRPGPQVVLRIGRGAGGRAV